jgi:tetratricopeptide (TPR) repeat protein
MPPPASESVDALFQRASGLHRAGDLARAEALYQQVIAARPGHWDALQLMGILAAQTGRFEDAVDLLARAVALEPNPIIYGNLARAQMSLSRFDEARDCADALLALQPGNIAAHMLRAKACLGLGQSDEALASYELALAIAPTDPDINLHSALLLLKLGRLDEGFRRFEHRFRSAGGVAPKASSKPTWLADGPIAGKTLFVSSEFYLGDLIQMARYAPLAEAAGAKVLLAAPPRLHRLFASLGPTVRLVPEDYGGTDYDLTCPLMSLPLAFGTQLESVPAQIPYLHTEPEAVDRWRTRLGGQDFKIGVCWQGSTRPYEHSMKRSFPVEHLRALADTPGVRLISLQKFDGVEQLDGPATPVAIETLGDDFDSGPDAFIDTAAVMQNLDLVITCDTAVAHLAGALGRPTWLALPYDADWRWLRDRTDSPWYPTMRLFRQTAPDVWDDVFQAMAAALTEQRAVRRPPPLAPVSWGELVDKITILEIKAQRITREPAAANIGRELALLREHLALDPAARAAIAASRNALRHVNEELWDVEDALRVAEAAEDFGERFVALARSVYRLNDHRAALKRQINETLGSEIVEEKSYGDLA